MINKEFNVILNWHAERIMTASLSISIGSEPIWPIAGDPKGFVEVQSDDLLSHLTQFWKPLMLRQTYPVKRQPDRPSHLRSDAERRWEGEPIEVIELEDSIISSFENVHDLSRCFAGLFDLPPLWILRQGAKMIIDTQSNVVKVDFRSVFRAFSAIGDEICIRLKEKGGERWSGIIKAWENRNSGDPEAILSWSASLPREVAHELSREGLLVAPQSVDEAANDNDELRIAARMASALPPEQIRAVISYVSQFPLTTAERLDDIHHRIVQHIDAQFQEHRPHEQGEAAATFLREAMDLSESQKADVFSIAKHLGIDIRCENLDAKDILALAVWGRSHGPAVLLNQNKKTSCSFLRVNLAHEIGHLLLDKGHAFTAVDVLNSRMPVEYERRAKAFAGEFLLPSITAADVWEREGAPNSLRELNNCVKKLQTKYGVTKAVAAWKLEHGLLRRDIDLRNQLEMVCPSR